MANESNLKPFKKGQSGNPKGRPKGSKSRAKYAREALEQILFGTNPLNGENGFFSMEELITLAQIQKAIKGNVGAYVAVMNSAYGSLRKEEVIESKYDNKPPKIVFT